jgi:hypothetical protein
MSKNTIDMARESKVVPVLLTPHGEYFKFLERFEALVRADEREACAKVCEEYDDEYDVHTKQTSEGIALEIRARGNI